MMNPFDLQNPQTSVIGISAMQELGNILSGSYLSALSDFTGLENLSYTPALAVDMFGAIISFGLVEVSQIGDQVIVIDTTIFEEHMGNSDAVRGHFFLLPDPDSFESIFKSLGVM